MKDKAFISWVQVLRDVAVLPNSTPHSIFHLSGTLPLLVRLSSLGTALGTRPHCCTPILVSLLCCPDATRYSHSSSTHRYSHSRTTHRHSHSHCCCRDRPHGLWELPPVKFGQMYSNKMSVPKLFQSSTGLRPFSGMSSFLRHYALSLCRFAPVYTTSTIALNAATLCATTILPRKARRDPIVAFELDASTYAFAYDTPPYAYA